MQIGDKTTEYTLQVYDTVQAQFLLFRSLA